MTLKDLKWPQKTSNDLKGHEMTLKESSPNIERVKPKKNNLKAGGNTEINDEY